MITSANRLLLILIVMSATLYAADGLRGAGKVVLAGPLTQEQMADCRQDARARFKAELLIWLEAQRQLRVDTTDRLINLQFEIFLDTCLRHAQESSEFKERYWTVVYTLTSAGADSAISNYNRTTVRVANDAWKHLQAAVANKNHREIYYQSVRIIAWGVGYMGPPLTVEDDPNKLLVEEARVTLRELFGRIGVSSTTQVIEGKPGFAPISAPTMTVTIDGSPFPGLILSGSLPGRGADSRLFTEATDSKGTLSLGRIVIPYVRNTAMLYVSPEPGRIIGTPVPLTLRDFGAAPSGNLTETFFFKLSPSTYTLDFNVSFADTTRPLPRDFISGAAVSKFLADSCFMVPATGKPDLAITIQGRIGSGEVSKLDNSEARFGASVTIKRPTLTPELSATEAIDFQKRYDKVEDVPMGTFVWESNLRVQRAIRTILGRI